MLRRLAQVLKLFFTINHFIFKLFIVKRNIKKYILCSRCVSHWKNRVNTSTYNIDPLLQLGCILSVKRPTLRSLIFVALCCVFWPSFRCCVHPKLVETFFLFFFFSDEKEEEPNERVCFSDTLKLVNSQTLGDTQTLVNYLRVNSIFPFLVNFVIFLFKGG